MKGWEISLFGRFQMRCEDQQTAAVCTPKVQELLCYLLLHHSRPIPREVLAGQLWEAASTTQSKKCLRQALWHLQSALNTTLVIDQHFLEVEADWVQLNLVTSVTLDVFLFERAFLHVRNVPGQDMDQQSWRLLQNALQLYRGDLLEGWYQDWCLPERERLQSMYIMMLDKLMNYCEAHHEYDSGIAYGALILRCDSARERTHRQLMRLYCLAGDRTGALRQYERCVTALQHELGVSPAKSTMRLYEQIRNDRFDAAHLPLEQTPSASAATVKPLSDIVLDLEQVQTALAQIQDQVQRNIQTIELLRPAQSQT
jgi:DNA-binding SARP family transcriptional activator